MCKIDSKNDLENPRSVATETDTLSNSASDISDDDDFYLNSERSQGSFFERHELDSKKIIKYIKYSVSLTLLFYTVQMIIAGILAVETPVAKVSNAVTALIFMWLTILWLGMLEGGQGCLVGLQPIDRAAYKQSHPFSYRCTGMVPNNEVLNRFIVGRQFFVVLMVYALNLCCTVVEDAVVPGFPKIIIKTVLGSGLAVMLITVILGQLSAEVTATNCMLDFINSRALLLTTWLCLAVEASGILHSVYVVRAIATSIMPADCVNSNQEEAPKRSKLENIMYWGRVAFSLIVLTYVMIVVVAALMNDQTQMSGMMSSGVTMVFFIFLICFLGMCEAMQIALFAVVNIPDKILENTLTDAGKYNYALAFKGDNFRAFLIGRQICVTMSMFWLARLTTTDVIPGRDPTVMGMGAALQDFFDTGLPGALITTIVASISWRVIASTFPIKFMGNPLVLPFIRLCLFLESTGVFSSSWLLADILKKITGFKHDEEYLGDLVGGKSGHGDDKDMEDTAMSLTETDNYDDYNDESVALLIAKEDNNERNGTSSNYGSTTTQP